MENKLQIFENVDFGEIRTVEIENEIFFVAADVCRALNLSNPSKAVSRLDDDERANFKLGRQGNTNIVNEYGLYNLVLASRKPTAKTFKRWITHDVIPAIRKTGRYAINMEDDLKAERIATMKRNAKVREANLWVKLAQEGNETFKQVCRTYAANVLAEREILALPKVEEKTYTATEIGKILGISANTVGKIANANGLKTAEYGEYFHDKSRYSNKEVESFRYYENAIDAFQKIIKMNEDIKTAVKAAKGGDDHVA